MQSFDFKYLPEELSSLDVFEFVQWKKKSGMYNFNHLPKTAILSLFQRKTSLTDKLKRTKLRGLNGQNYILKKENIVICEGQKSGGSALINLCEELRALGVENFIFLGLGGTIDSDLNEGELFYISNAWSGSGVSYYYDSNEKIEPKSLDLTRKLIADQSFLKATKASAWSTDAPFRESKTLINYYKNKGVGLVEMECAGLYAFSNYYHLNAACFVISSDKLAERWSPPSNLKQIISMGQTTLEKIIKIMR